MKLALMSEAPVSCRLRQRKETVAARRRIRSEICRSAGREPQLFFQVTQGQARWRANQTLHPDRFF